MLTGRRALAWVRFTRRRLLAGLGDVPLQPEATPIDEFVGRVWAYAKFGGVLMCCQSYLLDITMCVGPSMMPTFNTVGDIVLCDKLSPRLRRLKHGDVVVCKSPTNVGQTVCKRIVGMPGDELDGFHRDYAWHEQSAVPAGHIWLEGDNRRNSMDSRNYGPVPLALVQSRVLVKLWPLHEAGAVPARKETPATLRYSDSVREPFSTPRVAGASPLAADAVARGAHGGAGGAGGDALRALPRSRAAGDA
ncbi:hypothetical protein KFE25_007576 [Diacronema lutheri]|uniref:Peptidase S26 domain-containing protein n=2 Tax=Diacronema lutheri TaxID=2081491 RepID=A0A8J6CIP6_DIALT|nr:hypothetical protein KFE25_007576 [Diacronema lutheri]